MALQHQPAPAPQTSGQSLFPAVASDLTDQDRSVSAINRAMYASVWRSL